MRHAILSRGLFLAALGAAGSLIAAEPIPPVMVGGNDDLDACMSLAVVKARNFIYLKAAPSRTAANLGKLTPRQPVLVCDESEDGKWVGVVVNEAGDCGVSTSQEVRAPYKGKCASGWLEARQIEVVAG